MRNYDNDVKCQNCNELILNQYPNVTFGLVENIVINGITYEMHEETIFPCICGDKMKLSDIRRIKIQLNRIEKLKDIL